MNDLQKLADQFFQRVIDRQQGMIGQEESRHCATKRPTPEQQARWDQALEPSGTLHLRRRRLARTVLLAVLTATALVVTPLAARSVLLNWVRTEQEKYVRITVGSTVEERVAAWSQVYIPTYLPDGFAYSDEFEADAIKAIEYADMSGTRITYYQYGPDSNIEIDKENADRTLTPWDGSEAYLFQKGGNDVLYWTREEYILSIEYPPGSLSEREVEKILEGIQWKE